jgi:transcriptional regulator with XRE-family HTH domain
MNQRLGMLIRDARHRSGLTLESLAEQIGVTAGALSHIESGRRLPSPPNAVAIADALGLPREVVLGALDSEHSDRRRSSLDRKTAPNAEPQRMQSAHGVSRSYTAQPIGALFGQPGAPTADSASMPLAPSPLAGPARSSSAMRNTARWSDDTAERIGALQLLADNAADAIRTLRGLVRDEDPVVSREALRLLRELDVRLPDERP